MHKSGSTERVTSVTWAGARSVDIARIDIEPAQDRATLHHQMVAAMGELTELDAASRHAALIGDTVTMQRLGGRATYLMALLGRIHDALIAGDDEVVDTQRV